MKTKLTVLDLDFGLSAALTGDCVPAGNGYRAVQWCQRMTTTLTSHRKLAHNPFAAAKALAENGRR